jgi:predicted phage terminase large subunit-like protein
VHEQARLWNPQTILLEDMASGIQLLQELARERLCRVKGVTPQGDKIMRLHAETAQFENGFVILPKTAPWLEEYVNELISFPMRKYDDQVDSTAQALAWLSEATREPGIIANYRMLCETQGLT